MNTTENEIQILRRELDALRDENIALYNELTKQNKTLCEEILKLHKEIYDRTELLHQAIRFFNGQDLKNYLTRTAGIQTAKFIAQNMNKVKSFGDKINNLKYSVAQAMRGGYI